jgi:monofunctional biosynthetic peptidoglycan transglycosylase
MTDKAEKTEQTEKTEKLPIPWRARLTWQRILAAMILFVMLFTFWFIPYVPALKWDKVNVTRWEKVRGKVQVDVGPKAKGWVSLKNVSRHVIYAVVSAEDGRFYSHNGIDLIEMKKSLETNLQKGRMARGASTISQQVVKMAFLGREKTLIRKAREIVGTLLLEMMMSKDEIMEWYLNLAEFGDAVYGIEKASWHYFRTKPQLLSIEQAIHLALVLPSPNGWSKGLRQRNLTRFGHQRFRTILQTMHADGYVTRAQQQQAMARGNFGSPINGYVTDVPEDPMDDIADKYSAPGELDLDHVFSQSSFREDGASSSSPEGKKNALEGAMTGESSQNSEPQPANEEILENAKTDTPPAPANAGSPAEVAPTTEAPADASSVNTESIGSGGMAVPIETKTETPDSQSKGD